MSYWLKCIFADIKSGNSPFIFGNENIVIQDIQNSQITIGSCNPDDITIALEKKEELTIFIFIISNSQTPEDLLNWKPFNNYTIIQLIQKASNRHNVQYRVFSILKSTVNNISDVEMAYFKSIKHQSILIIDYCEEIDNNSIKFLSAFNDFQIGGCIFLNTDECELIKKYLNHIYLYSEEPLYSIIGAKVSKLGKIVNKENQLISEIGVLAENMGAHVKIIKPNSTNIKLSEISIK